MELFTSKVYFRSNSKTPCMRNSTRMRITLSVSPPLLLPAYFVIPVYALRVISPCHVRFSMAAWRRSRGKRHWFALREKRRRLALSRKVSSMIVLWHSIAFENIMMVDEVRYYAIKLFCVKWSLFPRRVTYISFRHSYHEECTPHKIVQKTRTTLMNMQNPRRILQTGSGSRQIVRPEVACCILALTYTCAP